MITIKRFQNGKLYNDNEACYVRLEDIFQYLKKDIKFQVIENKSKTDITVAVSNSAILRFAPFKDIIFDIKKNIGVL